jgi:hypothetical protein
MRPCVDIYEPTNTDPWKRIGKPTGDKFAICWQERPHGGKRTLIKTQQQTSPKPHTFLKNAPRRKGLGKEEFQHWVIAPDWAFYLLDPGRTCHCLTDFDLFCKLRLRGARQLPVSDLW